MTDIDQSVSFRQAQVMPYSPTAEEAVLGTILINAETLQEIGNLLPEDFYIERNRWIYITISELRRTGRDIDYLTVCEALDRAGKLGEVGGPARITSLINVPTSTLHIQSYADILKEKARRRRIIQTFVNLINLAADESSNLDSAVSAGMDALSRSIISSRGAVHVSHYLSEVYDEVDAAYKNPQEIYGISTGFPDWDKTTYGLQKGEVLRLGGEPGLGKSLLLGQVLTNVATNNVPAALYEIEMGGRQVVRREISRASKIATYGLRSGKITSEQWTQFTDAIKAMENLPIYISDSSNMTTADLRVDLQRLVDNFGIEVVGIDYEALLADAGSDENDRRSMISDRVHAIAKDLDLAVISIGDMTKAGIRGEHKGQGAMAGTAHELHNADEIAILRRVDGDESLISMTWEKLREGDGDRQIFFTKLPGLPAFGSAARKDQTQTEPKPKAKRTSKPAREYEMPDWEGDMDL